VRSDQLTEIKTTSLGNIKLVIETDLRELDIENSSEELERV
jgi:hypothetical protein